MARASLLTVRALLSRQGIEIDDEDLDSALTTATRFVDAQLADTSLTDALLIEIETYLTAHLVVLRDLPAGIEEQTIDRDQEKFSTAEGLTRTHFGQVAITLDVTGTLSNAGQPAPTLMVL